LDAGAADRDGLTVLVSGLGECPFCSFSHWLTTYSPLASECRRDGPYERTILYQTPKWNRDSQASATAARTATYGPTFSSFR
jgi:hypothetical protein